MKVLAVRQPWASLIADGEKTVEVRSGYTHIRERVAIYATRTKPNSALVSYIRHRFYPGPLKLFPLGVILATVEITGCECYGTPFEFDMDSYNHRVPLTPFECIGKHGWSLSNVHKLVDPVPFKMPKGAVIWANAEELSL